ncbi:hypothetical protein GCM10010392_67110 [Streptomyces clavifer]|nr:hypothetical protein GCM10010392_67110 [Streptomyces clavifer]
MTLDWTDFVCDDPAKTTGAPDAACGSVVAEALSGTSENARAAAARVETPATESFCALFRRRLRLEMRDTDMQSYLFE